MACGSLATTARPPRWSRSTRPRTPPSPPSCSARARPPSPPAKGACGRSVRPLCPHPPPPGRPVRPPSFGSGRSRTPSWPPLPCRVHREASPRGSAACGWATTPRGR
ncbi:MAG TPA: hypothetical protein DIU14_09065 [Actinobacteria bacterium]|nr:hypothetical protein [Actinomycetota bacterium]